MSELSKVFRIKENENGFIIQREFIHEEKLPKKWYEKQKFIQSKVFENISLNGKRINIPFGKNHPHSVLKTLEEAKERIKFLLKFPIYHDFNLVCDIPEFPTDEPTNN